MGGKLTEFITQVLHDLIQPSTRTPTHSLILTHTRRTAPSSICPRPPNHPAPYRMEVVPEEPADPPPLLSLAAACVVCVRQINNCYPPEVVEYYSPSYSKTLLDKIDEYVVREGARQTMPQTGADWCDDRR